MSIDKHTQEFLEALRGGRGELDSWLECNNEIEVRVAIRGALKAERERVAKHINYMEIDLLIRQRIAAAISAMEDV